MRAGLAGALEGWARIWAARLGQLRSSSMRMVNITTLLLVIVGAVNWGLVGLFQFDLVAALFGGQAAPLSRVVYALVGLSGVVVAATSAALAGSRDAAVPAHSAR